MARKKGRSKNCGSILLEARKQLTVSGEASRGSVAVSSEGRDAGGSPKSGTLPIARAKKGKFPDIVA